MNNKILVVILGCIFIILGVLLVNNKDNNVYIEEPLINTNNKDNLDELVAMYQESDNESYIEIDKMPSEGYAINEEKSYCYTNTSKEHDPNAKLYTNESGEHVISGINKSGKCYIWFDKVVLGSDYILANKNIVEMPSITGVATEDTTGTVYSVADDDGDSYVYRGAPTDNWVSFGGFYWRIIRINGDGSIRMIYNGTSTTTTGTGTQISGTYKYNTSDGDNAYVGYMYGSAGAGNYTSAHANINDSNIKKELDNWYTSSGLSNYAQYLDANAGFCNDRQTKTGVTPGYDTGLGYGTNATSYAPLSRLMENNAWKTTATPSLKCSQVSQDLFTVSSSNKGNKKLSASVGLITSDEVVFAGGFGNVNNQNYYLYTNQYYWTMSPTFMSSNNTAPVFYVYDSGLITSYNVSRVIGARPVINLRSDITLTGQGTSTDPYRVG